MVEVPPAFLTLAQHEGKGVQSWFLNSRLATRLSSIAFKLATRMGSHCACLRQASSE